jgi:hypothetical protein
MGIDTEVLYKTVCVAEFADGEIRRSVALNKLANQLSYLSHQLMLVPATAVPFQHGKFRIVPTAYLAISKGFSQAENITHTAGK